MDDPSPPTDEGHVKPPDREDECLKVETEPKQCVEPRRRSCLKKSCLVLLGILSLLAPISLGAFLAQDLQAKPSGTLLKAFDGSVVGAGLVLEHRSFADLLEIPEATLRRVRHCSFMHVGAFRRFKVASLVRSDGQALLVSPDRSTLRVKEGGLSASFTRPFAGEQQVDLDPLDGQPIGCTFTVMTNMQSKSS